MNKTALRPHRRAIAAVLTAAALLVALAAPPAFGATLFPPDTGWRTLSTEHFRIHYHEGLESLARELAPLAEQVHARQTERLGWTPASRTDIALVDRDDRANGLATPLPHNLIILFTTLPDGDAGLALNHRDWWRTLLIHEYTHILHLDRAEGLPGALRTVFGRVWPFGFPNTFNPRWFTEGLATHEETAATAGGRGRGALHAGILRAQAAEGKLLDRSLVHHTVNTWPGGTAAYLYGGHFLGYVERHRGEGTLERLVGHYSDNLIPFLLNGNFQAATKVSLNALWKGWQAELTGDAQAARARIDAGGLPTPERLTASGFYTRGPRLSPDGTYLAWSENTAHDHARILLARTDQAGGLKHPVELAWRNGGTDLAWSADGKYLYFTQPEFVGSFRSFNDIYRVALSGGGRHGKVRRITRGRRLRDVDVGPGGRLVAVQNNPENPAATALVLLDPAKSGGQVTPLLPPAKNTLYAHPRFSPDGRSIAVAVTAPDGARYIARVDAANGKLTRLTSGRDAVGDPSWSPDGQYLLFTSDRTGTFNLYAHQLSSGKTLQATDEMGGAFQPETAQNTLYYSALNGDGYDLYRVPFAPGKWARAAAAPAPVIAPALPEVDTTVSRSRRYSALRYLFPSFWGPVTYREDDTVDYFGIVTGGADPLLRHVYLLQAAWEPEADLVEVTANWRYDRLWPTVNLYYDRDYSQYVYDIPGTGDLVGGAYSQQIAADLFFPIIKSNRNAVLILGAKRENFGCTDCVFGGPVPDYRYSRAGLRYSSAQKYPLGISLTDGRTVGVYTEHSRPEWGSTVYGESGNVDWAEYLPIGSRHVLGLRLTGSGSYGDNVNDVLELEVGGPPPSIEDPFDREHHLRGYPERAFVGDRLMRGALSWRFPLGLPQWGPGNWPIFLEKLHGNLFAEGARIRLSTGDWEEAVGYGAELGLDITAGFYLPLTLRFGAAQGEGPRGETQTYVRVGLPL